METADIPEVQAGHGQTCHTHQKAVWFLLIGDETAYCSSAIRVMPT